MKKLFVLPLSLALVLIQGNFAGAAVTTEIDFESRPLSMGGGLPTDDEALTGAYVDSNGITTRFGLDLNGDGLIDPDPGVFFEAHGSEIGGTNGFAFDTGGNDVYDVGRDGTADGQIGNFLLRANTLDGSVQNGTFLIQFGGSQTHVVTGTFGDIWDIDGSLTQGPAGGPGSEQYLVEAFDSNGNLLASELSPEGTTFDGSSDPNSPDFGNDGLPWRYSFSGFSQGIDHLTISFTGTKIEGIGLAFDGGSITTAVAIPEPSAVALTGAVSCLCFGVSLVRRRRRRSADQVAG
ncbi:PEP-CTERM sorting domain-containing protein [Allorhodopirellula solitaria]|uniref:PEP-CTERM protein-sorting domain-containing protein n=1 Tax=Allorhodopirellula solitaria TaxID=2527987 RepID=A0A5C5X054_9BACT|nr:PEP-CTERM sorting domain-containing protein [Allorhodopirellula solitaria]TWT56326.1 hypothetical protein CA85_43290 [Allorhodopirellula solitaria]